MLYLLLKITVTSWKLSRQPTLSAAGTAVIDNVVDSIDVLDERYFFPQSHTEESCSYVPSANGEPVVFWGQCDNSVQAVANFDLARVSLTKLSYSKNTMSTISEAYINDQSNVLFNYSLPALGTKFLRTPKMNRMVLVLGTTLPSALPALSLLSATR